MPGPDRPGRVAVEDVTVILLAPPHGADVEPLVGVLDALASQTRPPQRVLVAGLAPEQRGSEQVVRHPLVVDHRVPLLLRPARAGSAARWQQVEEARVTLPVHEGHWIWFLSHDSRPEPSALAALIGAVRRSSRVGVVGPKIVRDDEPRLLRAVGHHLTPAGRVTDAGVPDLFDQGQLDLRQDVLGVPLAGAFVSSTVLDAVDGLDPAFGEDGVDGLDLSWRAHLAGHRVLVAPGAVLRQGTAGLGVLDPLRTRVRQRQLALARGPLWSAPWRALGVLVTSTLAALALLLVKRPAAAAGEWADVRAVLSPVRGWGARRRFRSRRTVRPRDLAGLHGSPLSGWSTTLDTLGDALDPRALRRCAWSWPLALALLIVLVLTAWSWRHLGAGLRPSGLGVVGPELGPATTDAQGLWASALDGWRGAGLGHDAPPEAWLVPAAALTALVQLLPGAGVTALAPTLAWVLVLAAPASVLTAYLGLRRATRRRWLRAGLALGWAGLAPLTSALGEGRVGPVVAHVLAPLLLSGYAVSASPRGGPRRTAAVFATVLGLGLAAAWVPLVLVASTIGGLVLLALGPGRVRWRGSVLTVAPWLLLAPWLPALWADPARLAGGAGATVAGPALPGPAEPWQLLLLHPGAPVDPAGPAAVPLWLTAPLWLAALASLLLTGRDGRRGALLVGAALVCTALALLAVRTGLGVLPAQHAETGLVVTAWPGTLLSLSGAALLLAAALALDRALPRGAPAVVAAVLVVGPVAALAGSGLLPLGVTGGLTPGAHPLPAVAVEQSRGPGAQRTLVLDPDHGPSAQVRVDLVGPEPEPTRILRDRTTELDGPTTDGEPVVAVTSTLVDAAAPDAVGSAVTALGAGHVLLRAADDHPLARRVDRVSGLTRVSSPPGQVLWRVAEGEPGRLHVVDAEGGVVERLDATGPHAQTQVRLTDVPAGGGLVVVEGQGWSRHAVLLLDDEILEESAEAPAGVSGVGSGEGSGVGAGVAGLRIPLPPGDYELTVDLRRPWLAWHGAALVLALVTAFLALPCGRAEAGPEERS